MMWMIPFDARISKSTNPTPSFKVTPLSTTFTVMFSPCNVRTLPPGNNNLEGTSPDTMWYSITSLNGREEIVSPSCEKAASVGANIVTSSLPISSSVKFVDCTIPSRVLKSPLPTAVSRRETRGTDGALVGEGVSRLGGMSTSSIIWITPLEAAISACSRPASPFRTSSSPPPSVDIEISSPCIVWSMPGARFASSTVPATTW
mmetsp:Transcript_12432/g.21067  ORF Transcript_12432/g.21067 Transcript_12432/m.21067 type:complete len:203 (-) Transcript_12432:627-1235(-)